MALTYAFKQSLEGRTRRSRRTEVVFFGACLALGLRHSGIPLNWHTLLPRMVPYVVAISFIYREWQRAIKVSSLDDRAMLEHGVLFDRLAEREQQDLLRRYRVGTYLMGSYPDEREMTAVRESTARAYVALRWLLPLLAVVYWAGWMLLPEGRFRVGWTDGPTVLSWMFLLVLALPRMIRLWTEPEDAMEPRVLTEIGSQRQPDYH